jgi:hypothetical protein
MLRRYSQNPLETIKVSENPQEIVELLAGGFEAHCDQSNLIFLKKRK